MAGRIVKHFIRSDWKNSNPTNRLLNKVIAWLLKQQKENFLPYVGLFRTESSLQDLRRLKYIACVWCENHCYVLPDKALLDERSDFIPLWRQRKEMNTVSGGTGRLFAPGLVSHRILLLNNKIYPNSKVLSPSSGISESDSFWIKTTESLKAMDNMKTLSYSLSAISPLLVPTVTKYYCRCDSGKGAIMTLPLIWWPRTHPDGMGRYRTIDKSTSLLPQIAWYKRIRSMIVGWPFPPSVLCGHRLCQSKYHGSPFVGQPSRWTHGALLLKMNFPVYYVSNKSFESYTWIDAWLWTEGAHFRQIAYLMNWIICPVGMQSGTTHDKSAKDDWNKLRIIK